MGTHWTAFVKDIPSEVFLKHQTLSGIKAEEGDIRLPPMEHAFVYGEFHTSASPKPAVSIPIGLYDYYPTRGIFAPGHINWQHEPVKQETGGIHSWQDMDHQKVALGVWGISHITKDRSAYASLGDAIEMILSGASRDGVRAALAEVSNRALGNGTYANGADDEMTWFYPPLIQVVFESMMSLNSSTPREVKPPPEKVDAEKLTEILFNFFYDTGSPLYMGVRIQSLRMVDANKHTLQNYGNVSMDVDRQGIMKKRMDIAGQASPSTFEPGVVTALLSANSTSATMSKPSEFTLVNAVEVLKRDPGGQFFDKYQEFPFDWKDEADFKSVVDRIVEGAPKDGVAPSIVGSYGGFIIQQMSKKSRRGKGFAKAMREAALAPSAPPRVRALGAALAQIVKLLLKA